MPTDLNPDPVQPYVLVADVGCHVCKGFAELVQELSHAHITVRDLSDANLPPSVRDIIQARAQPLLYTDRSGSLKVWRGLSLRLHLARVLGPRRSIEFLARVAQVRTDVTPLPESAPGDFYTRRQLLRRGSALGIGAAVLGLIPAAAASASAVPSGSQSPGTSTNGPVPLARVLAGAALINGPVVQAALNQGNILDLDQIYKGAEAPHTRTCT